LADVGVQFDAAGLPHVLQLLGRWVRRQLQK
jgi:hypothetical protein